MTSLTAIVLVLIDAGSRVNTITSGGDYDNSPWGDGGQVDAGVAQLHTNFGDPLYAQCPDARDSAPLVREGENYILPLERGRRLACLLTTCDERRQQLEPAPLFSQVAAVALLLTAVSALVAGFYFGWTWHK